MIPECDGRSDGRSDGQTESIMAKTALCIASYADALSKRVAIRTHMYNQSTYIHVGLIMHLYICAHRPLHIGLNIYTCMYRRTLTETFQLFR